MVDEKLKKCPLCGGEAHQWKRFDMVECANKDCDLNRFYMPIAAWQALPRVSGELAEIVERMRKRAAQMRSPHVRSLASNGVADLLDQYAKRIATHAEKPGDACLCASCNHWIGGEVRGRCGRDAHDEKPGERGPGVLGPFGGHGEPPAETPGEGELCEMCDLGPCTCVCSMLLESVAALKAELQSQPPSTIAAQCIHCSETAPLVCCESCRNALSEDVARYEDAQPPSTVAAVVESMEKVIAGLVGTVIVDVKEFEGWISQLRESAPEPAHPCDTCEHIHRECVLSPVTHGPCEKYMEHDAKEQSAPEPVRGQVWVPYHTSAGYPRGATLGIYGSKSLAVVAVKKRCTWTKEQNADADSAVNHTETIENWGIMRAPLHGAPQTEQGVTGSIMTKALKEALADRDTWREKAEKAENRLGMDADLADSIGELAETFLGQRDEWRERANKETSRANALLSELESCVARLRVVEDQCDALQSELTTCLQSAMSVDGDCHYCESTMDELRDKLAGAYDSLREHMDMVTGLRGTVKEFEDAYAEKWAECNGWQAGVEIAEGRIAELEDGGKVLVAANTRHFDSATKAQKENSRLRRRIAKLELALDNKLGDEPQCHELEEWIAENTLCLVCGKTATYRDGLMYHQCTPDSPADDPYCVKQYGSADHSICRAERVDRGVECSRGYLAAHADSPAETDEGPCGGCGLIASGHHGSCADQVERDSQDCPHGYLAHLAAQTVCRVCGELPSVTVAKDKRGLARCRNALCPGRIAASTPAQWLAENSHPALPPHPTPNKA